MAEVADKRSSVEQRILEEHRTIRGVTERVEQARDLGELLTRLTEFKAVLEPHFHTEEAPEGFFEVVRASHNVGRIGQLQSDHEHLLGEVDRLMACAQACLSGPIAEILRQASDLARRLRDHEAREDKLLLDAMYTDTGFGD
jgi:hypothetical protein